MLVATPCGQYTRGSPERRPSLLPHQCSRLSSLLATQLCPFKPHAASPLPCPHSCPVSICSWTRHTALHVSLFKRVLSPVSGSPDSKCRRPVTRPSLSPSWPHPVHSVSPPRAHPVHSESPPPLPAPPRPLHVLPPAPPRPLRVSPLRLYPSPTAPAALLPVIAGRSVNTGKSLEHFSGEKILLHESLGTE